jgi:1-pyrroline-5-carboxylate dehydrogenase
MKLPFVNEPFTDFSLDANRKAQLEAIATVEATLGRRYPIIIGGREIQTEREIRSLNPSDPSEVVALVSAATVDHADEAVRTAADAFQWWSKTSFETRARILWRAAEIMRRRKFELNAVEMLEAGKPWLEADGDVAEAIDFCDFYAHEAMRYGGTQPVASLPGEDNVLGYIPLGVCVVIPPWNFPLAITAGMTVAALVAGNTVVLKPASATPLIAWYLVDVLREAGLPEGVLQFLPGSGGSMGDALVSHPLTRMVAFTGSMEVGIHINELAAKVFPGQKWLKRVLAEMGGKDAIIVADDGDLSLAGPGIVTSAFGFQGQKCSACSRAILDEKVYDELVADVVARTGKIRVGPAKHPDTQMGPVITELAMNSILKYMDIGKGEGRLLCGGGRAEGPGYFLEPTIFGDVPAGARIEQEEIFGPVLACTRARDYDHALEIANGTLFGLTGAVYSRSQARLEKARDEFFVGNLYLNRKCTGAMVAAHPFGGFNMSGTDSKAGGRDYLLLFLQAKSVNQKF